MNAPNSGDLLDLTVKIVAAHVSKNAVTMGELPKLIDRVYAALVSACREGEAHVRPKPAVPIRKSVMPDYVVCLEDGKKLKMLKRHLKTSFNLTPEEYRERWGLASNYPMVAPNYAKQRSRLAKEIGLGTMARKRRTVDR